MTNEEASCVLHCPDAYGGIYGQKYGEALTHCFELLKQEPVLDKIRAEIEKDAFTDVNNSKFISVNRVNQIIDKYKAEREGEA